MRNKLSPYYDLLNETIDEEDRGDVSIFPAPATPSSLIEQVRQIITDFSNGELEFREVSGNSESEGGILLDFSDKDGKHRITFFIGAETNEDNPYPDIFQIWELDDEELSTEIEMRGTIFGLPPIFSLKQKQHLQQLKTILQKYLKRPAGLRESVDEEDFGDVDTFATPDRYQNSAVQDWIDRLVGAGLDKPGTINLCYFYMYNPEEIPEGFPDPESLKLFEDDILQILRTLPLSRFEESVQDEDDTEADVSSFPKPARKTYTIRYIGAYTSGGLSHPWLKETRFVASSLTDLFIKAACISSNSDPSRIDEDELEDVRKDYARYLEKYQLSDSEDSLRDWISHYSGNLIVSLTDQQGKIIFADDVSEEEASEILLESVRKLREEDDEDFGDVTLFDAPAGLEGQRIVVAVPDADDPEADAMYGKGYNGLTGEITEEVSAPTLPGIDRTDEQWFMVYLDDEYEESKYLMLPRRWFRVLDQDEQMGDVSNFEAPSLPTYRGEVRVADIVNAYRAKQTDEDIKSFTVQYLLDHISMEDFVEYRRNRDELQQLFKDVARGLKLRESIEEEDEGDVFDLPAPVYSAKDIEAIVAAVLSIQNSKYEYRNLEIDDEDEREYIKQRLQNDIDYETDVLASKYGLSEVDAIEVYNKYASFLDFEENANSLIGKEVEWTTLRGETHKGPIVELDGNIAYVDCEICGEQIAVEDGAYEFKALQEEAKSRLKKGDPKFMKALYDIYLKDTRYSLKDLPGFPEGLDLENCDIVSLGDDCVQFQAGGDWQNPVSFSFVVDTRGNPRISDLYDSIYKTSKREISAYIKQVKEFAGDSKKESKVTYRDVLLETRQYENAAEPTLGDMRAGRVAVATDPLEGETDEESVAIPPPVEEDLESSDVAIDFNLSPKEQQTITLYRQYLPQLGHNESLDRVSRELQFPYAAVSMIISACMRNEEENE